MIAWGWSGSEGVQGDGLQRELRKLSGVIDTFIILTVGWFHGCIQVTEFIKL